MTAGYDGSGNTRTKTGTTIDVKSEGISFGKFLVALTIVMSAVALTRSIDSTAAWFLVFIVLLGMIIGVNGHPENFVNGVSDFINSVLK